MHTGLKSLVYTSALKKVASSAMLLSVALIPISCMSIEEIHAWSSKLSASMDTIYTCR